MTKRLDSRMLVSLPLYRVMLLVAGMTPAQAGRFAGGLDTLRALLDARGARGMSAQHAIDAGLVTEAECFRAFGLESPD